MNDKTHFGFQEVDVSRKAEHVGDVFHSVAEEYDLMNDVMSFGLHRLWKKILLELAEINENSVVLDIASGTADIPKLISEEFKSASIHVTDINASMLIRGRERALNENFFHNCNFKMMGRSNFKLAIPQVLNFIIFMKFFKSYHFWLKCFHFCHTSKRKIS